MNNRFIEPVLTELSEPTNFFFEQTPELDAATGVIGHLRIDFGRNGKQFLHTWKQRGKAELNTPIPAYLSGSFSIRPVEYEVHIEVTNRLKQKNML